MSSDLYVPTPAQYTGGRDEAWRYDLLNTDDLVVGSLTDVLGGQVEMATFADIKTKGSLTMEGPEVTSVDWLHSRVRVWYTPDGWVTSWPLITGIPATPRMDWVDGTPSAQIDLYDKLLIPMVAKTTTTYTVDAGANPVAAAVTALAAAGQTAVTFTPTSETLGVAMVWDAGVTYLRIINDLLAAANYWSLSADGLGSYRMHPYQAPSTRGVSYTSRSGGTGIHAPEFGAEVDLFAVPNRWTSVATSDGDTAPLTATATDYTSAYGYNARGYWVDDGDADVAIASQAALDAHAARKLVDAQSVTGKYTLQLAPLPPELLDLGLLLRVVDTPSGLDVTGVVQNITVPIEGDPLVTVELREVA